MNLFSNTRKLSAFYNFLILTRLADFRLKWTGYEQKIGFNYISNRTMIKA